MMDTASTQQTAEDSAKLRAMMETPSTVAGCALRPLTAGSLALLQLTHNKFLTLSGSVADCVIAALEWDDLYLQAGAFLYLLSADPATVRRAALGDREKFQETVLEFLDGFKVTDLKPIIEEILRTLTTAFVGQDYTTEIPNTPRHHPN